MSMTSTSLFFFVKLHFISAGYSFFCEIFHWKVSCLQTYHINKVDNWSPRFYILHWKWKQTFERHFRLSAHLHTTLPQESEALRKVRERDSYTECIFGGLLKCLPTFLHCYIGMDIDWTFKEIEHVGVTGVGLWLDKCEIDILSKRAPNGMEGEGPAAAACSYIWRFELIYFQVKREKYVLTQEMKATKLFTWFLYIRITFRFIWEYEICPYINIYMLCTA